RSSLTSPRLCTAQRWVGRIRSVGLAVEGCGTTELTGGPAPATMMGDSAFKEATLPAILFLIKKTSTRTSSEKELVDPFPFPGIARDSPSNPDANSSRLRRI